MKKLVTDRAAFCRVYETDYKEKKELIEKVAKDITSFLNRSDKVVAIAANQLGYDLRMFAIKCSNEIKFFINPMITEQLGGLTTVRSKDPSLPDREFIMPRTLKVKLASQDLNGDAQEFTAEGDVAYLIQQEVQLLDGILLDDVGLEIFDDFDKANKEEQEELIKWYLGALQDKAKKAQEEVDADPEAKKIQDATRFIMDAVTGKIEIYKPMPKVGRKQKRYLKRKGLLDKLVDSEGRWRRFLPKDKK